MNYKTYSDLSRDIKKNLHLLRNKDYDLVVGIPRSGMIPAYMLALELNLDCTSLPSFLKNARLERGKTRNSKFNLTFPSQATNILLVDDSIASGGSLKSALHSLPDEVKSKVTTIAIYSSIKNRTDVDIYLIYLPNLRVFEWNIFHHPGLSLSCLDMDGLLLEIPEGIDHFNEKDFVNYLGNLSAGIRPGYKLHSLITNLGERFKKQTVEWLSQNNILYDNLVMLNQPSINYKEKAQYYKKQKLILFLQNNSLQAQFICNTSAKPVYCYENNSVLKPTFKTSVSKDPYFIPRKLKQFFQKAVL